MATNENMVNIPGRLHSVAAGGKLLGADEIYDDAKGKIQSEINASLKEAASKEVDTSIGSSSSSNLPTTDAVKTYVGNKLPNPSLDSIVSTSKIPYYNSDDTPGGLSSLNALIAILGIGSTPSPLQWLTYNDSDDLDDAPTTGTCAALIQCYSGTANNPFGKRALFLHLQRGTPGGSGSCALQIGCANESNDIKLRVHNGSSWQAWKTW